MGSVERLGNAERELLYTLHWILLEGPRICCVVDTESLLYPQTTIEQFVHVLIPHVYSMRESDLTFRLENGVAIWGPLWKHETPLVIPFITKVIYKDTESDSGDQMDFSARQNHTAVGLDPDFSGSTFFDVAVLKCLSSSGWAEDGVVWALRYLSQYLRQEFNLPTDVNMEPSVSNPAHTSLGQGISTDARPVDSTLKNSSSDKEFTVKGVIKIADGDMKNLETEGARKDADLSVCVCQAEESNSNTAAMDKEYVVAENLEALSSQSATDGEDKNPEKERNLSTDKTLVNEQNASKLPHSFHENKVETPGLERTGSIKLRIRVQSSPVLSRGGRVITAVASPSGSPVQYQDNKVTDEDNLQGASDSGTFHNTKVYIKSSNTLHVPSIGKNGANVQDSNSWLLDVEAGEDSSKKGSMNDNDISSSEAEPVLVGGNAISAEQQMTMAEDNSKSMIGPVQGSSQNSNSAFESIVSYECEEGAHAGQRPIDGPTRGNTKVNETLLSYKHLSSERPSSSHASSSSAESESQPLLNPLKTAKANPTPASILESFDTPRSSISINRDSFMRMDRYFVFPGAADYITTDGRLSILMILQALNSILRENPTSRICDASLTVLCHLVTIHESNKSKIRRSSVDYDDRTVTETQAVGFKSPHSENVLGRLRASFYGRPPSFLSLAMGCLVGLIKALGCPLG